MSFKRWSGFDSQSKAWQQGYDWAYGRGRYHSKSCEDAIIAFGYDLGTKEDNEFMKGAEFAQLEQGGG